MAENMNYLGMTPEERESELNLLYNSYEMYENTIKETTKEMKLKTNKDGSKMYKKSDIDKRVALIEEAKEDIKNKILAFGGSLDNIKKKNKSVKMPKINIEQESPMPERINSPYVLPKQPEAPIIPMNTGFNATVDNNSGFDLIPLPSNGECYYGKLDKVLVSPLCANDENMIIAPNLYHEDLILDYLLKAKIKTPGVDPMDMIEGDREAILLWLRADGYGNEYPIKVKDNESGEEFTADVDLSALKYKEFKLIGDQYGLFDYTLPKCGSVVKFKFLTHRDIVGLKQSAEEENKKIKKNRILEYVGLMDYYIDNDEDISRQDAAKVRNSIREIEKWAEGIDEEDVAYNHALTNRLEMNIVTVDGIGDRNYIHEFVNNLNVKDASSLRNYINDNEPGIDYHFTVDKPESLGGGSQEVFLQFDKFLFLNIK